MNSWIFTHEMAIKTRNFRFLGNHPKFDPTVKLTTVEIFELPLNCGI